MNEDRKRILAIQAGPLIKQPKPENSQPDQ